MKKIMITVATALFVSGINAQSIYDATKIASKDLNGTARFVGMGGAMSALGGDISTMGTNPAGIGIYRSNDAMTSFSFSAFGSESKYKGYDNTYNSKLDKNHWSYDNIGFVISSKIGNQTPLRYVNFGFNYHKSKSFYKNMGMEGLLNTDPNGGIVTQTYQMANLTNGVKDSKYLDGREAFRDPDLGWMSVLGWQGYLIQEDKSDPQNPYRYMPVTTDIPYSLFRSEERGGIDAYDFNVSFNFNDRVYLGLTVGAYDVDYSKYSSYDESYGEETGYLLESWNKISGSGFDFKMGAIIRPFEDSPFRIGLAVHTPTFYRLTYTTSAYLESNIWMHNNDTGKDELLNSYFDTYKELNNKDMNREFRLKTPWKYNVSLGYTVGQNLAIGAEYEYEDYSSVKFRYPEGDKMEFETNAAKMVMKGVNTFRIGAEYKVIPQFAFRLGYNYSSSIFKNGAIKYLPYNSVNTDTDFANSKSLSNYTLGIGYRGTMIYADLAYKFSSYKEDFYPFYNEFNDRGIVTPNVTKITNTRSQVLFTLGMRF